MHNFSYNVFEDLTFTHIALIRVEFLFANAVK